MTRTKDEARAGGLLGWNIACQVCGSFGATWVPDPYQRGLNHRFCSSHHHVFNDLQKDYRFRHNQLATRRYTEGGELREH